MTRSVALALTSCLLVLAARADDAARADRDLIQGSWKIVSITLNGTRESNESFQGGQIEFNEDGYTVRANGQIIEQGTQSLDTSRNPKTIDFKITQGPDKGKTQLGIYLLEGDRLRLCFADPGERDRPRGFIASNGSRTFLMTLSREHR